MNGEDTRWLEQFEKRIISEIASVKDQITVRHGFFLENYEKSCQDINKNTKSIKKLEKETVFVRCIQNHPIKSAIGFIASVLLIIIFHKEIWEMIKDIMF